MCNISIKKILINSHYYVDNITIENLKNVNVIERYFTLHLFHTVCQRSSDPFYVVTYYKKWVTTSGDMIQFIKSLIRHTTELYFLLLQLINLVPSKIII